jgi:hydroxymethylglutaryl-CoA lyase
VIPQMRDADEVMSRIRRRPGVRHGALVPNLKGAERALAAGADFLRLVLCTSETYNQKNVGMSIASSLQVLGEVVERADEAGVPVGAVLGVTFGCPFEGAISDQTVLALAREIAARGGSSLGLADSAGLANPLQVRRLVRLVRAALPDLPLWMHLHDTRGLGLANALAALEEGVVTFDTSFGGLGGCPIMRGASGNIATEDFVYLCHEMGVSTGVDLDLVREVSNVMVGFLGHGLPSRILAAGTPAELVARNRQASREPA